MTESPFPDLDDIETTNTQTLPSATSQVTEAEVTTATVATETKKGRKRKAVPIPDTTTAIVEEEIEEEVKVTKKRKRKAVVEMAPLAARSGLSMLVGAHVSMAKGVQNAITNSVHIGGNAMALFLKSQRKWTSPEMKEPDAEAFRMYCEKHKYDPRRHILPHGSYLINLAQSEPDKAKQAYDCFVDDLKRAERLGVGLYNFHPGSTLGLARDESLKRLATQLNRSHKETSFCKTVLENMCGHGNIIGASFEDLADVIKDVEDKSRVGVCLDTCHLFAAGHDIRTKETYEAVMESFDKIVGLKYLCALHINDSKAPLAAKRDLHQNIGLGFLGLEPFRLIMNDKRLAGLPMILETPLGKDENMQIWADEIKLLESLIGVEADDEAFLKKAKELSERGAAEREKAEEAVDKKAGKEAKKVEREKKKALKANGKTPDKKGGRGRKKKQEEESEEEELSEAEGCQH